MQELNDFLASWQEDPIHAKGAFEEFHDIVATHEAVSCSFKARPGVSYSLRARHAAQQRRELFVLIDVVDDEPDNRWLSVCFYAAMIQDPEERGDFVPQGLMGEDACCFNLDEDDPDMRAYIAARLKEALNSAAHAEE